MNLQILLLMGNQDSCILKTKTNNWRLIVFTSVCITIYIVAGTVKSNGVCVSVCLYKTQQQRSFVGPGCYLAACQDWQVSAISRLDCGLNRPCRNRFLPEKLAETYLCKKILRKHSPHRDRESYSVSLICKCDRESCSVSLICK